MIALTRFHLSGFVRSTRVVLALLALVLVLGLLYSGGTPDGNPRLTPDGVQAAILGAYGTAAAFLVPVCAWSAKLLLDNEPDGQRELSAMAAGGVVRSAVAGLLAAYAFNAALALVALVAPLGIGFTHTPGGAAFWLALVFHLLAALTGTVAGALAGRVIFPAPAAGTLVLIVIVLGLVVLELTPLGAVAPPLLSLTREAAEGPAALAGELPALGMRFLGWGLLGAGLYLGLRRNRV
ncbi:hypothetical protein [Bailinhaonella thermotolerans]|uniref:Uncharacterized protein n=1 Tax=Bailinhaonella thermotolerans TaxID=1070861 RepID=A0A3A4ATM1_9ACTN|nr:hypothetical protein [Bailinhaonella thermotolerans]RJL24768.1 hypothetical protein D5H75_28700 [Bailinhaonella thermotolerans]